MSTYYHQQHNVFSASYLSELDGQIRACPYFAVNNLNRDFVNTKGFSVVFRHSGLTEVERQFPFLRDYLAIALQPDCNAFYLNPLLLNMGSRVDPHIDRSLRSYCKTVEPPAWVSVLYVKVPVDLQGGELILQKGKRQIAQIQPQINTLLWFQGDLTHSITPVSSSTNRLSLVCEQYSLSPAELQDIPEFTLESRVITAAKAKGRRRSPDTPKTYSFPS
jgi:hypothetical protein